MFRDDEAADESLLLRAAVPVLAWWWYCCRAELGSCDNDAGDEVEPDDCGCCEDGVVDLDPDDWLFPMAEASWLAGGA